MQDTFNIQLARTLYNLDKMSLIKLSEDTGRLLIVLDCKGALKFINKNVEKVFGWVLYESLGRRYETLCQESNIFSQDLIQKIPTIFQGFTGSNMEISLTHQSKKRTFSCEATCFQETTKDILIIGKEITAQKAREETLNEITHYLFSIFQHFPVGFFWKDESSNFLGADPKFLAAAGLQESNSLKGLSDFDLPWKKEESIKFRKDDSLVINKNKSKLNMIEEVTCADRKRRQMIVSKIPLLTEEKDIIGTIGVFLPLQEIESHTPPFFMMSRFLQESVEPENRKFLFYHDSEDRWVYLTKREKECLHYKIMGKTAKEIGRDLDISYRVVEFHINNLKKKLNFSSRHALYEFYFSNLKELPSIRSLNVPKKVS